MAEPATTTHQTRKLSVDLQSAENQISTVDDQLNEMQKAIDDAELQIEAMEQEIRNRKKFITSNTRKMTRLAKRRDVFIEASAALRKLEGVL